MSQYYAKSENSFGEQVTVKEHLRAVSQMAKDFAKDFGMEAEGELVGLLHDFGKYSPHFQNVLKGEESGIDHAYPGASLAMALPAYIPEVIAAHHSGLQPRVPGLTQYQGFPQTTPLLSGRISSLQTKEEYKAAVATLYLDFPEIQQLFQQVIEHEKRMGWRYSNLLLQMLRSRMLLSCLVDADYTVSGYESSGDKELLSKSHDIDTSESLKLLCEKHDELAKKPAPANIKALRNMVWEDCGAAAKKNSDYMTLTAPTGSGKTLGFVRYTLGKCQEEKDLRRIIIVLPYLTLVDQVAELVKEIIPGAIVDTSTAVYGENERELTERWSAPCIVTTTVQFFGSLFSRQPGDVRKLHNLAHSIIICDEIQALPDHLAETALQSLSYLVKYFNANVLLSTATPPAYEHIEGLDYQPEEIIQDIDKCFALAPAEKIEYLSEAMSPQEVAEQALKYSSCCVIMNMKRHARAVYQYWADQGVSDIYLLSTDLCPPHRRQVIEEITDRQKKGLPVHVAATQCIEAGVDLDFEQIYRAIAPLPSLIQSAGRQNRSRKRERGTMYTFPVKREPEGWKRLYPDADYEGRAEIARTMAMEGYQLTELSSLEHYYSLRFEKTMVTPEAVTAAIKSKDYVAFREATKIIGRKGVQVVVPYDRNVWEETLAVLHSGKVTKGFLRKVSGYTVQSYDQGSVEEHCQELCIINPRTHAEVHTGIWCVLEGHESCYDAKTGLQFKGNNEIFMI